MCPRPGNCQCSRVWVILEDGFRLERKETEGSVTKEFGNPGLDKSDLHVFKNSYYRSQFYFFETWLFLLLMKE